jgi:hypothetical protein
MKEICIGKYIQMLLGPLLETTNKPCEKFPIGRSEDNVKISYWKM